MGHDGKLQTKNLSEQFLPVIVSLLVLAGWIWILNWLSVRYGGTHSYLRWFLKNGSMISASTAFLALVWTKLGQRNELLSLNPLLFLAACTATAGQFFLALGANLRGSKRRTNDSDFGLASAAGNLWDSIFAMLMDLLMALTVLAWLLLVAPGFYLLTLFTGAPARMELRGNGRRLLVKEEGNLSTIISQPASLPVPDDATDISFAAQPFVVTNAVNALVLLIADKLVPAVH